MYIILHILFCGILIAHKENVEKLETEAKEKHDKEWEGKCAIVMFVMFYRIPRVNLCRH